VSGGPRESAGNSVRSCWRVSSPSSTRTCCAGLAREVRAALVPDERRGEMVLVLRRPDRALARERRP
jgi:hypothetical protein